MKSLDVVVVGAGIVGASLALALADTHLSVAVVETHPPQSSSGKDWDTRVYTITPGNREWLECLGVWKRMDADRICRVETMAIFGDQQSGTLEFNAYDAGMRELAYIVENRELQTAL